MVGTVFVIILLILVVSVCCCSDSNSSSKGTAGRNATTGTASYNRTGNRHSHHAYCECPSCGAPYYDGYCDECGYPDINQGWIGENY